MREIVHPRPSGEQAETGCTVLDIGAGLQIASGFCLFREEPLRGPASNL